MMKRKWLWGGVLLGFLMAGGWPAWSAAQTSKTPSLGEYARKLKAQRAEEHLKPVKVYTNDNIPRSGALSTATAATPQPAKPAETEKAPSAETPASASTHDEKYYRNKLKELQDQKELHERELAVLQQKVGVNQTQYFSDPNKTLQQESTPAFYSDVSKLREDIAAKKQQIDEDQQAIDKLHQQCMREGCSPGWLR
jgi:predicted negative regulator of RcsB-dependent stress response